MVSILRQNWWVVGLVMMTAACGPNLRNIGKESDPTRFYTLTATASAEQVVKPAMPEVVVRVAEVNLADYLDRSQMVRKESGNQLNIGEFDRWAAKPNQEIARVMAENLRLLLGTEHVLQNGWKGGPDPRFELELAVEQMDYDMEAGKVRLGIYWQVRDLDTQRLLAAHYARRERESAQDFSAISANLSAVLAELAMDVSHVVSTAKK